MRARDGNGGFEPHQFGQHFRPANDRHARFQRQLDLRVAALDRGGRHHHGGIAQIFRLVADHHADALGPQPLDHIAFGHIATLNIVAQIVHHLGNARHADAANADEMDRADVRADTLHERDSLYTKPFGLSLSKPCPFF